MPTVAEREEVCRHAALHLRRMQALRRWPLIAQGELASRADFDGSQLADNEGNRGSECLPPVNHGILISALQEPMPIKPLSRTFLVPMSDEVIHLFTWHASQLLKLARLLKCSVELKRCAVSKKLSMCKSWTKFAKIVIQGHTLRSIATLDSEMRRKFPVYLNRKAASGMAGPASELRVPVCMFLDEGVPDNASLMLSNQRTGAVRASFGAIRLSRSARPADKDFERLGDVRTRHSRREPLNFVGFSRAAEFVYSRGQGKKTSAATFTAE